VRATMSAQAALFGHFYQKSIDVETLPKVGPFLATMSELGRFGRCPRYFRFAPKAHIHRKGRHASEVPILLQKSFCTGDQKFSGL
jgi:hypothetical protein